MCACSRSFPNVSYNRMSASFTVRMHCYCCFLLQHALSFLAAAAHLQTCPSVFTSASLECWKTHFISGPWEPALTLTFGSIPSLSPLSSHGVSVLLALQSALYPSAFSGLAQSQSQDFYEHANLRGIFLEPALKTKVGLIILGGIFNLCMNDEWCSSLAILLLFHLFLFWQC